MRNCAALVCLISSILSGCMSMQRQGMTTYEQYSDQNGAPMFKYMAMSTIFYPTNSPDAEATRMELLQVWLSDNSYCKNGYSIIDKKLISRGPEENAQNIFYTGKCK